MDKTIFLIFVLIFVLTFSSAEEIIWKFNSSEDFFDSNYSSEYYMVDSDNDNLIIQSGLKNAGFNNLWVANAGEGTISKINTKTNTLVAKYRTGPWQLLLSLSPSRTAVDGEGNVWVGNRFGDMNVIKIAADEENCIDKNGNGVIDTSKGLNDVKPWDNNGPQDECILFYVNYWGGGNVLDAGPRAIAIDLNGKVWVGIHSTSTYYKLNSEDGSLNATVVQQNNLYPGMARPYGAVIDGNGILWSLNNFDGNVIGINTVTNKQIKKIDNSERLWDYYLYGITVSKSNKIYLGASFWYAYENIRGYAYIENNKFIFVPRTTFDPDDNMNFWGRGVTFDNDGYLWIAGHSGNTGWLDTNGRVYKINPLTNRMVCKADIVGNAVGVVVDSDYNLWTIVNTEEGRVYKLDKNCNILTSIVSGNRPYTYSDATGAMLQQFISKGWWKVTIYSNDGNPIDWSNISWTAENPIKGAINLTLIFSENQGTLSFFNQSVFGRRNFSQDLTGYLSNNLTIYIKLEKGKDAGDLSPILSNLIIRANKSDVLMNKYCGDGVVQGYLGEECDGVPNITCANLGLGFTNGTIGCYPAGHPLNCTFNITGCWTALFGPDECVVIRMRECRNVSGELLVVDIARTEWVGLGAVPEGCLVEDIESVTDASCNFLKLPFFSGFSLVLTIIILIIFYIVFVKKNKSKGKKK